MLLSIALIILVSLTLTSLFQKIKIPGIIAMIITGILLGSLGLISDNILAISTDLREIALIVILLRAGLTVDLNDLKKVGKTAILLSFVPATIEITTIALLAPVFFDITLTESLILGSVIAAVSPAIVVPRMIHLIEKKYGTKKSIPQMILAAASIDDIYVIILFTSFVQLYQTNSYSFMSLLEIPLSIILGAFAGILVGLVLVWFFKKYHFRDTIKVMILFSVSFLFIFLENTIKSYVGFSGLLAIMVLGGTILEKYPTLASRLTTKFSKIWVLAEIMLFVLVGAITDVTVLVNIGLFAVVLLIASMFFRMVSVYFITGTAKLSKKERVFASFSYLPKATVQAAIGAIPLSLGIENGNLILIIAVLSIVISAPIGAILIDSLHEKMLTQDQ